MEGHSYAARIPELCDAEHLDQRSTLLDTGVSAAVERSRCPRQMDGGRVLSQAEELSLERLTDPASISSSRRSRRQRGHFTAPSTLPLNPARQSRVAANRRRRVLQYNKSHDRQIAGYGEAMIRLTGGLSLASAARIEGRLLSETTRTATRIRTPCGRQSVEHLRSRPGGPRLADGSRITCSTSLTPRGSAPAATRPSIRVQPGHIAHGFLRQAPITGYGPDNTKSFEVGAKNNFDNVFARKQRVLHRVEQHPGQRRAADLSDPVDRQPRRRRLERFRHSGRFPVDPGLSVDSSYGYTDARYTKNDIPSGASSPPSPLPLVDR